MFFYASPFTRQTKSIVWNAYEFDIYDWELYLYQVNKMYKTTRSFFQQPLVSIN